MKCWKLYLVFEFLLVLEIQMLPYWFMSGKPCLEKKHKQKPLSILSTRKHSLYYLQSSHLFLTWLIPYSLLWSTLLFPGEVHMAHSNYRSQGKCMNLLLTVSQTIHQDSCSAQLKNPVLGVIMAGNRADVLSYSEWCRCWKKVKFIAPKEISLDSSLKAMQSQEPKKTQFI